MVSSSRAALASNLRSSTRHLNKSYQSEANQGEQMSQSRVSAENFLAFIDEQVHHEDAVSESPRVDRKKNQPLNKENQKKFVALTHQ